LLSNEITGLLKDSKTNIFKQGEVANFIIELSEVNCNSKKFLNLNIFLDRKRRVLYTWIERVKCYFILRR
ncbi:hypothetical protein, partial [Streptococcus thermophilus]